MIFQGGYYVVPGQVKRKFIAENNRIHKSLKRPLSLIHEILPYEYNGRIILNYFQELYPFEWQAIVERCNLYHNKDMHLKSIGKKERYKIGKPETFFLNNQKVKNMLSTNIRVQHKKSFNSQERNEKYQKLKLKREKGIQQRKNKINQHTYLMQEIDPYYLDAYITAFHQKGISIEEKIEILKEISKFNSPKSQSFFYKINDSEHNNQLRNFAFTHLQKSGKYVKLRKDFKGKKKNYMIETAEFDGTPASLVLQLNEDSLQNKKSFGVFISHSYKDAKLVREIVGILNKQGLTCYCDWTSDNDFLKRSLVSEYTKEVLKKRIEQSEKVLFIRTENSMSGTKTNSPWINLELEHSKLVGKQIYYMDLLNDKVTLPFKIVKHDIKNKQIFL